MTYQLVDANFVLDHDKDMPIIDVRPAFLYEAGHIPGAKNVELMATLEEEGDGAANLAAKVEALGINPDEPVIVYCQAGVMARQACELLQSQGFTHLNYYGGSWTDWSSDDSRPVEKP